jgi:hypothetical protein
MRLDWGTFMKRTISFLLVLMVVLASFACTPKSEPNSFTPLEEAFRKVELLSLPNQSLYITDRWLDAKTILKEADWVSDDTVVDQNGELILTAMDTKDNTYAFYQATTPYVVITRKSDKKTFGFTITPEILQEFEHYVRTELVIQTITGTLLSGLWDPISVDRTISESTFLESISTLLKFNEWELTSNLQPQNGTKRFLIKNKYNEEYTLYSASPKSFAVVTRTDQSTHTFIIPDSVIPELTRFVNDYTQTDMDAIPTPEKVYIGTRSGFSEDKLVTIPYESVANFLEKREINGEAFDQIDASLIDPDAPILYITLNTDGTYTTVYADEPDSQPFVEWYFKVSIGKDPFHGPENLAYSVMGNIALMDYALLALFPLDTNAALDFKIDTQTTYEFPKWTMEGGGLSKKMTGRLNADMINLLQAMESKATLANPYNSSASFWDVFKFTMKNSSGVVYTFISNGVFVDTDPTTPGAIFYRFDSFIGNSFFQLEYLTKVPATIDYSSIKITHYKIPDTQGDDETWVELTSSQSQEISQLIQASTWTNSEFYFLGGGGDPDVILKTDKGDILYFLYWTEGGHEDFDYMVFLYNFNHRYYLPMDEFQEILTVFQSFQP